MGILANFLNKVDPATLMYSSIVGIVVYVLIKRLIRTTIFASNSTTNNESVNDFELNQAESTTDSERSDEEKEPHESPGAAQRVPFLGLGYSENEMQTKSTEFMELMQKRRTLRDIGTQPVPIRLIETIIETAATSPSGANLQPYKFVLVKDEEVKHKLRAIIEREEQINYERRMGPEWVADLQKFKVNWIKPYLTNAPYLILVMRQAYGTRPDGSKQTHYYSEISTSIAVGILVAAIQVSGLCTVVSTPLNCGPQIKRLLNRPDNEKLLALLPVGLPREDATVPKITRKKLTDVMDVY